MAKLTVYNEIDMDINVWVEKSSYVFAAGSDDWYTIKPSENTSWERTSTGYQVTFKVNGEETCLTIVLPETVYVEPDGIHKGSRNGKLLHTFEQRLAGLGSSQPAPIQQQSSGDQDELTGCLSQSQFEKDRSEFEIKAGSTLSAAFAMDVSNFKILNDKTSHEEGDIALMAISQQIKKDAGILEGARVYRRGGDEFTILVHCAPGKEEDFKNKIDYVGTKLTEIEYEKKGVETYLRTGVVCRCGVRVEMADKVEHRVKAAIMKKHQFPADSREYVKGVEKKDRLIVEF